MACGDDIEDGRQLGEESRLYGLSAGVINDDDNDARLAKLKPTAANLERGRRTPIKPQFGQFRLRAR